MQRVHHCSSEVVNSYVIQVKFLNTDLVSYFSESMAISEAVSVVLSGTAVVLALNGSLSRKKKTKQTDLL